MTFLPASFLNHENAAQQLAAGLTAIKKGQTTIVFSQTTTIDSSAVACIVAWRRCAQTQGSKLELLQLPANLHSLMVLYGVDALLS